MNLMDLFIKIGVKDEASSAITGIATGIRSFAKVGVAAVGAIGTGMIAFSKSAVDTGKEFDKSMSQVAATLGVTTDEIDDLRTYAMEMGATTAFSAVQAADALNYMALAGYNSDKSMKMLPSVLDLAAAGSMDLARASDMVTDAESALGLTSEETAQMVDQMARTASRSNTSVEQLGDAILTIGGTANFMAGGTDRLNTVLGILADNGIKGSEAGIHLRNMLLKLSAPTDKGTKLMKKMGLEIYDGSGKMRDMQDIMLDLNEAMSDMTEEDRVQTLSELFNARDLSAVNALLHTSAKRWDELGGEIKDAQGAAKKMAETQLDNLAGDVTLFKSAMEGAKITLSNALTPALRGFVQTGTAEIGKLDRAFQDGGISGLSAQLGNSLAEGIKILATKAPEFASAAIQIGKALVKNLGEAIMDNSDNILKSALSLVSKLGDGLKNGIPKLGTFVGTLIGDLFNNLPGLVESGFNLITGMAQGIWNGITSLAGGIRNRMSGALEDPIVEQSEAVKGIIADISSAIENASAKVSEIPEAVINADADFQVAQGWVNVFDDLAGKANLSAEEEAKLKTAVEELNKVLPEGQKIVQDETGAWSANTAEIQKNIEAIRERQIREAFLEYGKDLLKETLTLRRQQKSLMDDINERQARQNVLQSQISTYKENLKAVDTALKGVSDEIKKGNAHLIDYDAVWNSLPDSVRAYAESVGISSLETYGDLAELKRILQEVLGEGQYEGGGLEADFAQNEADIEGLQTSYDELSSKIAEVDAAASNALSGAAAEAYLQGEAVGAGLASGIDASIPKVRSAAGRLAAAISVGTSKPLMIRSPSKLMKKYGKFVGEGLSLGLRDRSTVRSVEESANILAESATPNIDETSVPSVDENGFSSSAASNGGVFKLYLDGDKLVGGTSKRMDSSLGNMQQYQLRWEGA